MLTQRLIVTYFMVALLSPTATSLRNSFTLPAWPQANPSAVPASCPVTQPPAHPFVPPPPYPAKPGPQSFWYGTEKLWTFLQADGVWNGLPHYTPDDPTFRQKLFYWRAGFDAHSEPRPALTITGKRLDHPAPPLASDQANAGWQSSDQPFMVTGINLPTLGCWQITARYGKQALTFTVRVTG
jgi:hypothetical protein